MNYEFLLQLYTTMRIEPIIITINAIKAFLMTVHAEKQAIIPNCPSRGLKNT
jgi:hypothetical protein